MQGVVERSARTRSCSSPRRFPLPHEYRFFSLTGPCPPTVPGDLAERTAMFLDCGNLERARAPSSARTSRSVNIDHHHDNTRFGTINHVVPEASCTAEIVWDLCTGSGVDLTPPIAEALYVGLVTDTGRFIVREHRAARPPDGRRADRGRGRRRTRSTAGLRGHPVRQARSCSAAALASVGPSTTGGSRCAC